jgi:hypothetical protein
MNVYVAIPTALLASLSNGRKNERRMKRAKKHEQPPIFTTQ